MLTQNCRTARTLGALMMAAGLAAGTLSTLGCSSSGSGGRDSITERANAFKPSNEAYAALGYRHIWTGFPTMSAGATVETMEVLDDVVAVQDTSGVLTILEASSGSSRWSDQLGNPLTKFIGVTRVDKRIVCSSETEAYFLDADTGTLVGKQQLGKVSNTRPVQVGNLLVFGTNAGEVFAQMIDAGFRVWGTTMPGGIEVNPARLSNNTLGFVSSTGDILFVDGATGSGYVRSKMFRGTRVAPASSGELMFVASADQSLYAFSPSSPSPIWRHRTSTPLNTRPTFHEGTVYCSIQGEGLTAFTEFGDGGRGSIKWVSKGVYGTVIGVRGGRLLVWDGQQATLIDATNGDVVERVKLPDAGMIVTDGFVDGNLFVTTPGGVVIKLSPRK